MVERVVRLDASTACPADGAVDGRNDNRVSVREIVEYATREMPNLADRLSQEPISRKPVGYSRGADFALAEI